MLLFEMIPVDDSELEEGEEEEDLQREQIISECFRIGVLRKVYGEYLKPEEYGEACRQL